MYREMLRHFRYFNCDGTVANLPPAAPHGLREAIATEVEHRGHLRILSAMLIPSLQQQVSAAALWSRVFLLDLQKKRQALRLQRPMQSQKWTHIAFCSDFGLKSDEHSPVSGVVGYPARQTPTQKPTATADHNSASAQCLRVHADVRQGCLLLVSRRQLKSSTRLQSISGFNPVSLSETTRRCIGRVPFALLLYTMVLSRLLLTRLLPVGIKDLLYTMVLSRLLLTRLLPVGIKDLQRSHQYTPCPPSCLSQHGPAASARESEPSEYTRMFAKAAACSWSVASNENPASIVLRCHHAEKDESSLHMAASAGGSGPYGLDFADTCKVVYLLLVYSTFLKIRVGVLVSVFLPGIGTSPGRPAGARGTDAEI